MRDVVLSKDMLRRLRQIYEELGREYDNVAEQLNFSCAGCPDNCCDSYFLHHTYAEWAYLQLGFQELDPAQQDEVLEKSRDYIRQCRQAESEGERPQSMCPLNKGGLCILYEHRMLVCRTHGVPATMMRPDGRVLRFPGCFRCQEIVGDQDVPSLSVERTPMLRRLALLESELLDNRRHLLPRVKMTIAEMIVKGPPVLPIPHCERNSCV
ncbi:MAG: hypothetical protein JRJ68_00570 [Deltaproteobacteria bacterium]|nr:hypothetical protein [Deltaproteobacteria bacterium]